MENKIYSIEEIKRILNKSFRNTKVKKAILFGSYAKGNATESSDIDLLIDSEGKIVGIEIYGILQTLIDSFNKRIDLIERKEVISGGRIDKEITKMGVVVYEK